MRLAHVLAALAAIGLSGAAQAPRALAQRALAQRAPAASPRPGPMPAPLPTARPASPACLQVQAGSRAATPVRMQLTAEHAEEDPARVWTAWDIWNPLSPQRTAIWTGVLPTCGGGEIIVSQIVNRQCSSNVECPARIVHRQPGGERVLLGYEQVCTLHDTFQLQADLAALRACGVAIPLRTD